MNVFIAMSILRKLRDRNKFTNEFCDKKWEISYFPKKKGVRRIDSFDCDIERFYDMKNEIIIEKDFGYIANLFVHSNSMSFSNIDKKRKVSEFYISSDYKQEKHYYKIPMHIIISILEEASKNHPHKTTWQYDEKKGKEVIVNE
ncbi:MAG: hypothetical protein N4A43_01345 [Alphaproteobacteria bacterium]|nr:hypothetical protein [Alphaproteobacteria bacterium]